MSFGPHFSHATNKLAQAARTERKDQVTKGKGGGVAQADVKRQVMQHPYTQWRTGAGVLWANQRSSSSEP